MKRVVPFTPRNYHPLARATHDGFERVDVSADPVSYYQLVRDLWHTADTFLLVEHDIEINDQALLQAEKCPCVWGTSPYNGPGGFGDLLCKSLGFVRFRAELMIDEPDVMQIVGSVRDGGVEIPAGDYRRLDVRISQELINRGYEPHVHASAVQHHHVYRCDCVCGYEHEEYSINQDGRYESI